MGGMIFIPGIEAADLTDKATVDAALVNSIYWPPGTTELCGIEVPGLLFALSASTALNPYPLALFGGSQYGALWRGTLPASVFDNNTGGAAADPGDPVGRVEDQSGNGLNLLQATGSLRPLAGRRPKTGVRNLLTYTEDFSNAAWVKSNVAATASAWVPEDGGVAFDLNDTSGAAYGSVSRTFTVANDSVTRTFSVAVKKTTGGTAPTLGFNVSYNGGSAVSRSPRLNTDTGALIGGVTTGVTVDDGGDCWIINIPLANNSTGNTALTVNIYPATAANGSGADVATATGTNAVARPQVEVGATRTAYQRVGASLRDVTEEDVESVNTLYFDGVDDVMSATITAGITGQVAVMGDGGMYVEDVTIAAAGTFSIGGANGNWSGAPIGILKAVRGEGVLAAPAVLDIALREGDFSADEIDRLERYAIAKGGKGLLVPTGGNLAVNGDFATDASGWTVGTDWTYDAVNHRMSRTGTTYENLRPVATQALLTAGHWYLMEVEVDGGAGAIGVYTASTVNRVLVAGNNRIVFRHAGGAYPFFYSLANGKWLDNFTITRLINMEDL